MNHRGTPSPARAVVAHPALLVVCGFLVPLLLRYNAVLLSYALEQLHGNDFGKFYYAVQAWVHGSSLYASTVATRVTIAGVTHEFPDLNPPHFHLLVWPFVGLPLSQAFYLWIALNGGSAVVAAVLLCRGLRWRPHITLWLPAAVAALLCASTGAIFFTGQYVGLMMVPTALAWRAAREGRHYAAGAWLGLLISVKPFLGLFILVWVVRREWVSLLTASVACGLAFGVGAAVFGVGAHRDWLQALQGVSWPWADMNGSLQAVLARALQPSPAFTPVLHAPRWIRPLWLLSVLSVAAWTAAASRRSVDHAFTVTVLGALLISPLGWVYYLWLVLPAAAGLWWGRMPRLALVGAVGLSVPFLLTRVASTESALATLTIGSTYTWATLALWIAAVQTPAPAPPSAAE